MLRAEVGSRLRAAANELTDHRAGGIDWNAAETDAVAAALAGKFATKLARPVSTDPDRSAEVLAPTKLPDETAVGFYRNGGEPLREAPGRTR